MIAMQYSIALPADYDMDIIARRIREKGPLLDGFPHLAFKAYLSARREGGAVPSHENLYAPFYLWAAPEGMDAFLTSPGFAGLARDFGWPMVRSWIVWQAQCAGALTDARFASRRIEAIAPHADLAALKRAACGAGEAAVREGALAAVCAFNPADWSLIHFRLWPTLPMTQQQDTQLYEVGHVSLPAPGHEAAGSGH